MRLALLGLTASFVALPLAAQAQVTRLSQSSVSLEAIYSRPGESTESVPKNDKITVTTVVDSIKFRNADLLEVMLAEELLPEGEDSIKGWSLVAVWADWEAEGQSSYRFFARKKVDGVVTTAAVPDSLLQLELLAPYVQRNIALRDGEPASGSELYKAVATVRLGADTYIDDTETTEDDTRQIGAGSATGVIFGPGRYARPSGSTGAIYLPGANSFTGYGTSDDDIDVVTVRLRLGKSQSVPAAQYSEFIDTENAGNSRGPDDVGVLSLESSSSPSSVTKIGGGTLTLGGSNTSQGSTTTIVDGVLVFSGGSVEMSISK